MPCTKGMHVRRGDQPGSGCRVDCQHRAMVQEYQLARYSEEQQRDAVCLGGAEEERDYGPLITFKRWLKGLRR